MTMVSPLALLRLLWRRALQTDILNNALGGNNVKTLSVDYIPMRDLDTDHNDDSLTTAVTTNPARPWFGTMFVCEQGLEVLQR